MNDTRTKNTIRNIKAGLINQIVSILLPFINRTAVLWILGAEFTGIASLFSSILNVLNIAELGFHTAIVYSLYKPMAEKDNQKICELVSLYKKIYSIVGTIVIAGGLIILPFITYFIDGSYPNTINIYIVYLLYLINSGISYFLFSYKESLLIADQRNDISTNIRTLINILRYVLQLICLIVTKSFYLYLIVSIIGTIMTNISIQIATKKRYPFYKSVKTSRKLPKELKKHVEGLMIGKICDTLRNSFDSVIISSLFGLTATAVYGNYYYIYSALYAVMLIICNSMSASVGNSIIKKTEEENYENMLVFSQLFSVILGVCTVCLLCVYQPFMSVWAGEDLMLSDFNMILFCIYFYAINLNNIRNQYISGTGLWWKLKFSYVIEAVGNLVLNIVLGMWLGISGIILATIITILLFNYFQRNKVLFNNYFKNQSIGKFYKQQFYYFILTLVSALICYFICSNLELNKYVLILVTGAISVIVTLIIYLVGIRFTSIYQKTCEFVNMMVANILKKNKVNKI